MVMRLYLLGPPRLELDGVSIAINRRKVLALLVYLALTQYPHRRDHLATLFWPDYDQSSARTNLRRALSTLNQTLNKNWLHLEGEQVSLKRNDDFWLDVDQFQQLVAASAEHGHPSSEVCADCLEPLGRAVVLYQDDLLTGFTLPGCPEFDDWQLFQTESLRRKLAEALEKLVRGHAAQGEFEPAIEFARRWLALDPLQEAAQRQLMRLLTFSGKRNAALTQYESCRQILADELGMEPTAETTALYQQIRQGELVTADLTSAPPPLRAPAPKHNLPPQLTPFIGREEELAKITDLIQAEPACRLLTLIGPGGIGKTRLAIQAAQQAVEDFSERFPDGVYFVSLAPVSTAESVLPTMADALRFPLSGGNPKEQLLNYLSKKTMLVVLDNFEHLIPHGVTDLLSEMTVRAPRIKLLVTSRERLNLQEEWGLEVRGLRFPTGTETEETSLEAYEGIQLFVQRAQRARPGFTLSQENGAYTVRIGQLVRGMPLGLELAASWLRMMTCQEIAREIERNLDFLTTSHRDMPERHQSLRAVFEQSWQLLTEAERPVFRKLSVFRGGFHRRAAERVAGASLPLLSALVDKSLLRRTRTGRYEIHELLRQYAAEKLSEVPDEKEQTQDRHADFYLTLLQQRTDDLKKEQGKQAIEVITEDIDNVRAAWFWAITQKNVVTLSKAAYGLTLFYDIRGWFLEGEAAYRHAVEMLTIDQVAQDAYNILMAQMLLGKGWFSVGIGLLEPGQKLLKQSVSLLRQAGPGARPQVAHALFRLAQSYIFQGYYSDAKQHAQESLAIYTEEGDPWGIGNARWILCIAATYQGAYAEANQLLQKNARTLRQLGDHKGLANTLLSLGLLARTRGEYARAERFLEESLQISRAVGHRLGDGYELRELGFLAMALGNYSQAKERMQESLVIFKDLGWRTASVFPLDGLGSIARLLGDYRQAEQLHQESLAICQEVGEGRGIALCLQNLGHLAYDMEDYPTAEHRLQESLTQYKEIGNRHGVASALCHLGYAVCASNSDRHQEAGQHFNQALEIAAKIDAPPLILDILVGLATLLVADEPEEADQEQAVELLVLVLHHPASEQETKDKAKRLLAELAAGTPSGAVETTQKRGQTKPLESVVAAILEQSDS